MKSKKKIDEGDWIAEIRGEESEGSSKRMAERIRFLSQFFTILLFWAALGLMSWKGVFEGLPTFVVATIGFGGMGITIYIQYRLDKILFKRFYLKENTESELDPEVVPSFSRSSDVFGCVMAISLVTVLIVAVLCVGVCWIYKVASGLFGL